MLFAVCGDARFTEQETGHVMDNKIIPVYDERSSYRLPSWVAFLLYCLLTLGFTYPAALHLGARVIGSGDAFMFLWDIWWFKHALVTLHTSPLVNNTLFYPLHNIPMVWSTPVNELGSIPLQMLFGNLVTYNLLILTHFILSGFFAFLFLKKLVRNDLPAFLGGVIYTFSTYHFVAGNVGTLGLTTIEFIPLFLYAFLRFIDEQTIRNVILMTLCAILVALSDPYIAIYFLVTFSIVFVLYALIVERGLLLHEKRFWGFVVSGILTAAAVMPFYLPMIGTVESLHSAHMLAKDAVLYSEDLLGYFLPTHTTFLWSKFSINYNFNPTIAHYFIGYVVLVLGLIGIFKSNPRFKVLFLTFLITAFVLSLGPYLQINGPILFNEGKSYTMIPMPYYLIWKLPVLDFLRFPNRYSLDVELMLSIFAASGLSVMMRRNVSTIIAAVVLAVVIPFETITHIPFTSSDAVVPAVYKTLKSNPSVKAIYDLPSGNDLTLPYVNYAYKYMYYQTYHHKPIVYGHLPRTPNHANDFTLQNPLLQVFSEPQTLNDGDIIQRDIPDYVPYGIRALNHHNIRVVILHKTFLSTDFDKHTEEALYRQLTRILGKPVVDNHRTAMFDVPRLSRPVYHPIVYLGTGWYEPRYYQNGIAYRWMSNDAEIRLSHWNGGYASVEFSIFRPFTKVTDLDVFVDATLITHLDISSIVSPHVGTITIPSVYLPAGHCTIVLHVEQGPFEPFFMEAGFPDVNLYSLAISQVVIKPAAGGTTGR